MKGRSPTFSQVALDIVGSTKFGRYPKISLEETFNMIISDNFLVDYAGHDIAIDIEKTGQGRGIFTSVPGGFMIVVVGNGVFRIEPNLDVTRLSTTLHTSIGDVFIDENNTHQIIICDKKYLYIYKYLTATDIVQIVLPNNSSGSTFVPGYISYQDGRFLSPSLGTSIWRLSEVGIGDSWPADSQHEGLLQTKPDTVVAAQRFPGRGNLLYLFGMTIVEPWTDIGAKLFPYQRNSSVNIDYGCVNPATIAYNDNIIVWLAANEKSGPMIAYSTGGDIKKISTDGIDFKLAELTNPGNSYGFLFRQDGHLLYQITFPDDNLTYVYDFNTQMFFTLCDENFNYHIAKRVAFFNDKYYFVSFKDGNVYQMSSDFTTYSGKEIPRIRICKPLRLPDTSRFSVNNLTFTIEQGVQNNEFLNEFLLTESGQIIFTEDNKPIEVTVSIEKTIELPLYAEDGSVLLAENGQELFTEEIVYEPYIIPQRVGLSLSKNGGESFGSTWWKDLNPRGKFRNRLIFWNLGAANDMTFQIRFQGLGRFVATDGITSIFQ